MSTAIACNKESLGRSVMRATVFLSCLFVLMAATVADAGAVVLKGSVSDTEGKPVGGAMITVKASGLGSMSITTYTGNDGRFSFPDMRLKKVAATALTVQKVGYVLDGAVKIKAQGTRQVAAIRVKGIDNVADQVPPSAWLAGFPDVPGAHGVVLRCSVCHEFPFAKARNYIEKFSMLPVNEREKVWYDVMKFMRVKTIALFGDLREPNNNGKYLKLPLKFYEDDNNNFVHATTMEPDMAPILAKYMPAKFDSYPLADYQKLLAPVGGPGTVLKIYDLPQPKLSLFHDNAVGRKADGTTYVYAGDMVNPRLARFNPATGEIKLLPLPKGLAALHTLVPGPDNRTIWGVFQVGKIGQFDVETETWKTWDAGDPAWGLHSIAYKGGFEASADVNGCVWLTLNLVNKVMKLDLKTGKYTVYDAPPSKTTPLITEVYGTVMSMDGKKVWFTQLEGDNGAIFSINVNTGAIEDQIAIPNGDGPRRLTIDKNDVIYVPMDGGGYLYVYDTRAKKEVGRYPLPDRAAATYSANWDGVRNAVWMGGGNASKVYKFDVASKSYTEYPLPPSMANKIIRALPSDQKTGDVYFSYTSYGFGELAGGSVMVHLHPDDAEVAK